MPAIGERSLPFAALALGLGGALVLGPGDQTMHWFWNRIVAHFGPRELGFALGAAALGAALPRPVPWPVVALLGYAPFARSPQSSIDTALYAEYALRAAREGLGAALWRWPEEVWRQGAGQLHMPLVPLSYGAAMALSLPWRAISALWSLLLAYGAHRLGGPRAAALLLAVPFAWCQSGLMLVDLPTAALVSLAVAALVAEGPVRPGRRALQVLLALGTKVSAGLFLAGPAAVQWLRPWESRRRAGLTLGLGALAVLGLFTLNAHHLRPLTSYLSSLRSLFVHAGPWVILAAIAGLFRLERRRAWTLLAALGAVVVLLRYAPVGHIARYALPLAPVLCAAAAAALSDRGANALAGFGLAMGLFAYRPLAIHHQAANLDAAVRAIPADAVGVELSADYRGEEVPPWFLAPIAQLGLAAPVVYVGEVYPPRRKEDNAPRWWDLHPPDPHFLSPRPADFRLVIGRRDAAVTAPEGFTLWSVHDRYQGSSFAFPPRVLLFSRRQATSVVPSED